jgi:hypothetical protein
MDNTWPAGPALGMANHSDAISNSIPRETATKDNRTAGDDRKNGLAHHGSPLPPRFAMMVYRGAWNATTIRFHGARRGSRPLMGHSTRERTGVKHVASDSTRQ